MSKYVKPVARDLSDVMHHAQGWCTQGTVAKGLEAPNCENGALASGSACYGNGTSVTLACRTGVSPSMICSAGGTDEQ